MEGLFASQVIKLLSHRASSLHKFKIISRGTPNCGWGNSDNGLAKVIRVAPEVWFLGALQLPDTCQQLFIGIAMQFNVSKFVFVARYVASVKIENSFVLFFSVTCGNAYFFLRRCVNYSARRAMNSIEIGL